MKNLVQALKILLAVEACIYIVFLAYMIVDWLFVSRDLYSSAPMYWFGVVGFYTLEAAILMGLTWLATTLCMKAEARHAQKEYEKHLEEQKEEALHPKKKVWNI